MYVRVNTRMAYQDRIEIDEIPPSIFTVIGNHKALYTY